jgi:hypothetical protein
MKAARATIPTASVSLDAAVGNQRHNASSIDNGLSSGFMINNAILGGFMNAGIGNARDTDAEENNAEDNGIGTSAGVGY